MKKPYKISIIGCGNMGTVIMERLLAAELTAKKSLVGCDQSQSVRSAIERIGIKSEKNVFQAIKSANIIFLAVKPQQYKLVAEELEEKLKDNQLVISVIAGVTYKALSNRLAHKNIVRTMPNLAAKIGKSITAWYAPTNIAKKNKTIIMSLLSVMGISFQVKNESMIDKVTAISGSGPAYFFYTAELLEQQACGLGFTKDEAAQLVTETFHGAAQLSESDARSSAELRKAVTSKKGITEAALNKLGPQFVKIWKSAVQAAYQKAKVISKKYE
ncbi:pyrroline-5-carboxylate reductase [Patescibacteria group bacterium]|nr:pyrroline-5-carboxylate reductase [Patescibacteria group bacterium]MBU1952060.1 pyrroline-5-carboxylate reductase [Patescibacteria group bacterium]